MEEMTVNQGGGFDVGVSADAIRQYASACQEVFAATTACLDVANQAVNARNAQTRPQHEMSIRNLTAAAETFESSFAPLYEWFDLACDGARYAAAALLATQPLPEYAEVALARSVIEDVLDDIAFVRVMLTARFGPSPSQFIAGIQETNQLVVHRADGNIYRPSS